MSESYNVTGKVVKVGEVEQITDTFCKRELWVETDSDSKYPQTHGIEFKQDKTSMLDAVKVNDVVSVECNLEGRIWKDRVFNSLAGWKLDVDTAYVEPAAGPPDERAPPEDDDDDTVPF